MAIDLENFAAVFSEGLSADDRKRFEKMLAKKPDEKSIWSLVLESNIACLDPVMYIRRADKKMVGTTAFNKQFTPLTRLFAKSKPPSDLADGTFDLKRATRAVYEPGQGEWVGTQFNMWRGVKIEPLAESPEIFLDHINYLIPDPRERGLLLDFLAWMVQHPDKKMMFALLIVGRGGTGKSWLSGLLQALFGPHNALVLPKGEKVADKFNAEHANKQAVFVDELVPSEKLDLVRAIDPMITSSTVWVEPKGVDKFEAANRFNIVAVSNHENAVRIARDSRRWLVVRATGIIRHGNDDNQATDETDAYFARLFDTVTPKPEGTITPEVRRIFWFLRERDLSGFNGQSQAPITETKIDVAESSESTTETKIRRASAEHVGPFACVLLTVQDVMGLLGHIPDDKRKAAEAEAAAVMEACGCQRIKDAQVYLPDHRGKVTRRERLWISHPRFAAEFGKMTKAELVAHYRMERELVPADVPYDPAEFEPAD